MRTSNGCWTCRLRRKKCDEKRPVCAACAALDIKCHFNQDDRPEWMDGSAKQGAMAEQLKREIKEKARSRREERALSAVDEQELHGDRSAPSQDFLSKASDVQNYRAEFSGETRRQRELDCALDKSAGGNRNFDCSDTILLTFYLENLLPFLFPLYRPSFLQGGRAWIFELMLSSPVVRKATLCQSTYFFSLAKGTANHNVLWEEVLMQTTDALRILRQALQIIEESSVAEHLHGGVRILASIMQMQRFEIAISSFANWQNHLCAAISLFKQLIESNIGPQEPDRSFNAIMAHLGAPSSSRKWPSQSEQVPSAEQAAFRFSSTLLIFDDIIASTALQEKPKLYKYHRRLLSSAEGAEGSVINMEAVVGVKNWILLHIGEIAALDGWKQQSKTTGNLDVTELVRRVMNIKGSLLSNLTHLEADPEPESKEASYLLDAFVPRLSQGSLVSHVWTHAALLYLAIVAFEWPPPSANVRYHVSKVIELLKLHQSPALLRTVVWPFCVAGCLAEPTQESHFRDMVQDLQPPGLFGTVHMALEIMENVWRDRGADIVDRHFATRMRIRNEVVLLV